MIPEPDKEELRRIVRQRRSNFVTTLPAEAHRFAFHAIPSPLGRLIADRSVVALYAPIGSEAPALRFADGVRALGKILCLPRVVDRIGNMEFHVFEAEPALEDGPLGTRHPAPHMARVEPDIIIAPLVAFDRNMNRLGQGGGYYDRAFARFPDALRVGLAWSIQEVEDVPADPWDLPLHAVVTECEFIEGELP